MHEMLSYIDYIIKTYNSLNGWDEDNLYPAIAATPKSLLYFDIPNGISLTISKLNDNLNFANCLTLSNSNHINGSLSYLYSSSFLNNAKPSKDILLQNSIGTYRFVDSISKSLMKQGLVNKNNKISNGQTIPNEKAENNFLIYGKMNFPGNVLEGLLIKNFTKNSRVLMKCLSSNSKFYQDFAVLSIFYQENNLKDSTEFIYSSNENLIGFRKLYNIDIGKNKTNRSYNSSSESNLDNISTTINGGSNNDAGGYENSFKNEDKLYGNSRLSLGTEIWYGISNMSPGLSSSLRYTTYSTYNGKPLTMVLTANPLIGLINISYNVKPSLDLSFCTKYDFNIYSYESNLSFGCELWKNHPSLIIDEEIHRIINKETSLEKQDINTNKGSHRISKNQAKALNGSDHDIEKIKNNSTPPTTDNIENFRRIYSNLPFTNVFKVSTSINDLDLRTSWQGKFKNFLLEFGFHLYPLKYMDKEDTRHEKQAKLGISIQFSS